MLQQLVTVANCRQPWNQIDRTMNETEPSRLPPGQQLAAIGKWPLIGEREPRDSAAPWTLTVDGLVKSPQTFSLAQLRELPQGDMKLDIHCVTRWSQYDMPFRGVRLAQVLELTGVLPEAKFISFVSRSTRDHSSSLELAVALQLETLIALDFDGRPLAREHGGPIRNIVPRRYFYKSVKWLERIELLAVDRLGFWEAESGYHNHADPWREERYMAPQIDRRLAQQLIAEKKFANLDLRSIDCSLRDLSGLDARGAALRDANFREARLVGADFSGANLSNAHFERADLRNCRFLGADLEGADFSGADLRGANLTGASLTGTTFGSERGLCRLDAATILPDEILGPLTPDQTAVVQRLKVDAI